MNHVLLRVTTYVTGLVILAFGIALTLKADLGAGAWDALNAGLVKQFGFTVGTWVIVVGVIVIMVNAALLTRRPDLFALIPVFLIGPFVDFFMLQLLGTWEPEGVILRLVVLITAVLLLAFGIAVYLQAGFAPVPFDGLMMAIQERTGLSLRVSKTAGETAALIAAFLAGGPIGLGTIIVTFFIGTFIQFFTPYVVSVLDYMKNKEAPHSL
ncbi:YczE/YyaS/YitT family protein [Bacillus marinisedimentorum]|uniref:YczE/YyaS/YitT family protein n=1 Tax=Bacillus marinisedimentorum TaxID=1821260 RepID=UPI000871FD32|nr:YitT family protein [Bacillus marinisedimentorum]